MKCENVRDLLTTDYIDGELDEGARKEVVSHLESCARCRQFEEAVQRAAVAPFRGIQICSAPASLWHRVRRGIEQECEGGLRAAMWSVWKMLVHSRRAVFAGASLAAVIIIAVFLARVPSPISSGTRLSSSDSVEVNDYVWEQFLALSYEGNNETEIPAANGTDHSGTTSENFGTVIEQYLL
jgi:anti-sigma factor RsiW